MKVVQHISFIFAFLLTFEIYAHCGQLSIIDLKNRTADEIIRIIQPLLGPGDTISGKKNVIFLTTTPERLARIQAIIRNLDKKIRQVKITVVQGQNAREAMASVDVSGNISIGDNAKIKFGRNPQPEDTISITGRSGQSGQSSEDIQQVSVQEGMSAIIYFGQSIPVSSRTTTPNHGGQGENFVEFREVRTGFKVKPRLAGDRFVLDIVSQSESTPSVQHGVVDAQQIQTQIQGKLDEWIEISGILSAGQWRETGIAYDDEINKKNLRQVFLKIAEVQ